MHDRINAASELAIPVYSDKIVSEALLDERTKVIGEEKLYRLYRRTRTMSTDMEESQSITSQAVEVREKGTMEGIREPKKRRRAVIYENIRKISCKMGSTSELCRR